MVKQIIIILFCLGLISSCAPTRRLSGGTKILANKYRNIDKFEASIYEKIDTNYFYKEVMIYYSDFNFERIRDYDTPKFHKLQFYPGGYVRILSDFSIINQDFSDLRAPHPDPEVIGMRGVIYRKNGILKIDSQIADDGGTLARCTYKVKVEGDKIYLMMMELPAMLIFKPTEYMCTVYEKSEKVPEDWKQYKPDW